jgi:hypothetical protein
MNLFLLHMWILLYASNSEVQCNFPPEFKELKSEIQGVLGRLTCPFANAPNHPAGDPTQLMAGGGREVVWGIERTQKIQLGPNPIVSFASINSRFFASSDGVHTFLWGPNTTPTRIDLPSFAIVSFPSINSIATILHRSTRLHFVEIRDPFQIHRNPQPFSNKLIVSMFLFARSSIFVCAGHGIMISKVICDMKSAKEVESMRFEKIAELYDDHRFHSASNPIFVESFGIFILSIGNSLSVHDAIGTLRKRIPDLTANEITAISFSDTTASIVVCDLGGSILVVSYSRFDVTFRHNVFDCYGRFALLFSGHFLIVVDSESTVRLSNRALSRVYRRFVWTQMLSQFILFIPIL